jgi:hypothetical protein
MGIPNSASRILPSFVLIAGYVMRCGLKFVSRLKDIVRILHGLAKGHTWITTFGIIVRL